MPEVPSEKREQMVSESTPDGDEHLANDLSGMWPTGAAIEHHRTNEASEERRHIIAAAEADGKKMEFCYELDAVETSTLHFRSQVQRLTDIFNRAKEATKERNMEDTFSDITFVPFQKEAFTVSFNMYRYTPSLNPQSIEPEQRSELFSIEFEPLSTSADHTLGPSSPSPAPAPLASPPGPAVTATAAGPARRPSGEAPLCALCAAIRSSRAANTRAETEFFAHHTHAGLRASLLGSSSSSSSSLGSSAAAPARPCPLCALLYRHCLRPRPAGQVALWFRRYGRARIKLKPQTGELWYLLGEYYAVALELFRRRGELALAAAAGTRLSADSFLLRDVARGSPLAPGGGGGDGGGVGVDGGGALDVVAAWVGECLAGHPACAEAEGRLPARLLDVDVGGGNDGDDGKVDDDDGDVIRLVDTRTPGVVDPDARYVALSYCWGEDAAATTATTATTSTSTDLVVSGCNSSHGSITLATLPRTFVDAVAVARALGVRYLWIDALCAARGLHDQKEEDRERECRALGAVFSGSFLTIAALDARHRGEGFLRPRERDPEVRLAGPDADSPENLFVRPASKSWIDVFGSAPLNKRAWALQERLLSKRILHFGRDELFWECCTHSMREAGSMEVMPSLGHGYADAEGEDAKRLFSNALQLADAPATAATGQTSARPAAAAATGAVLTAQGTPLFKAWYLAVQSYTHRRLAGASDAPYGILGLAAAAGDAARLTYREGVWLEDLRRGLLWKRDPYAVAVSVGGGGAGIGRDSDIDLRSASQARRAPSWWSWTSARGPVSYDSLAYVPYSAGAPGARDLRLVDSPAVGPLGGAGAGGIRGPRAGGLRVRAHTLPVRLREASSASLQAVLERPAAGGRGEFAAAMLDVPPGEFAGVASGSGKDVAVARVATAVTMLAVWVTEGEDTTLRRRRGRERGTGAGNAGEPQRFVNFLVVVRDDGAAADGEGTDGHERAAVAAGWRRVGMGNLANSARERELGSEDDNDNDDDYTHWDWSEMEMVLT